MRAFVNFCLQRRLVVLVFVVIVVAAGIRGALQLPIDAVPDITNAQIQVLTNVPSLGPVDAERMVTYPVEAALQGIPGVEEIRSVSRFGLSAITVVFEEGTDLLRARQWITERLGTIGDDLPEGAQPEMAPLSSGLGEVLQFELRSDRMCEDEDADREDCHTAMELRSLLDSFVSVELRGVPGVIEVNSFGGELKTYEVEIDPSRMRAYNISLDELFEALEDDNRAVGGGTIARAGEQLLVRGDARVQSLQDIEEILVVSRPTSAASAGAGSEEADSTFVAVRVADLGRVHFAPMLRQGAVTRDGRGEVVTGIVMMLLGANGREVTAAAQERLLAISDGLPEGVSIEVFYDRTDLVMRTIKTVATNLAEGALFVVGVLFLMLGSLRGGLIVAAAIPFAMLVAFSAMEAMGLSGNLMSLGAIDFGIVVDGSIIVTEAAVVSLLAARKDKARALSYQEAADVVLQSTLGVRRAAVFGEAIIVLVYLPLLTLSGVEGRMFKPMALTVLFALAGAFVASLTFVPVLVATFMRDEKHQTPLVVRLLRKVYPKLLEPCLRFPKVLAAVLLLTLAGAGVVGSGMGAEFVPRLEEGALAIQILRLPSVSLDESIAGTTRFERVLHEFPEVESVISKTGRPEIATDPMGVEITDAIVMLYPFEEWTSGRSREGLVEDIGQRLRESLPGLGFAFSQPIQLRMSELIHGSRADIAITLYGEDLAKLERTSNAIQAVLNELPAAADVRGEQLTGLATLEVRVDRMRARQYGVSAHQVMDAVATMGGRPVGEVYEGPVRYQMQVRLPRDVREDLDQIRQLPLRNERGGLIALEQVATLEIVDAPASVSRSNVRRRTQVEMNVRGQDIASFVAEAKAAVAANVDLAGTVVHWGGQFENLEQASARLATVVPLTLLIIFMLLYMAFADTKAALLIFLNVPFAAVGGVFLLAIRGMPMSISAAVGFIALFGIAVLNGVVLLTTIKKRRGEGKTSVEAARQGANERLRAVVMTGAVAALGFLPMAIASGAGAEVQRPLATVVIGGLVSATFLTLFALPSLYAWLFRADGDGAGDTPAGEPLEMTD